MTATINRDYIKVKNAALKIWLDHNAQPSHVEIRADDYIGILKIVVDETKRKRI